jgi:hypothetical protein
MRDRQITLSPDGLYQRPGLGRCLDQMMRQATIEGLIYWSDQQIVASIINEPGAHIRVTSETDNRNSFYD